MSTLLKLTIVSCAIGLCCFAAHPEPPAHDLVNCASGECCLVDKITTTKSSVKSEPLVCSLNNKELIERRDQIRALLSKAALEVKETDAGFAITFDADHASDILEFVQLERECCTFFHFTLEFPPKHGSIVLSITGPGGSKAFLEPLTQAIKPVAP